MQTSPHTFCLKILLITRLLLFPEGISCNFQPPPFYFRRMLHHKQFSELKANCSAAVRCT